MRAKNTSNKEFKTLVISILNELAESIDQNTDHLNKEPQNIKKWRKVKLKIDNSMFEIKKKKKPVRRSEKQTDNEEHICDLKDRIMGENESNIQDLWDSLKCSNLCIIGVPEGEERENGIKNRSEEIMAENVSNLKEKDIQPLFS